MLMNLSRIPGHQTTETGTNSSPRRSYSQFLRHRDRHSYSQYRFPITKSPRQTPNSSDTIPSYQATKTGYSLHRRFPVSNPKTGSRSNSPGTKLQGQASTYAYRVPGIKLQEKHNGTHGPIPGYQTTETGTNSSPRRSYSAASTLASPIPSFYATGTGTSPEYPRFPVLKPQDKQPRPTQGVEPRGSQSPKPPRQAQIRHPDH